MKSAIPCKLLFHSITICICIICICIIVLLIPILVSILVFYIILHFRNLSDGRFRDEYSETVKMSTYLAAFVVSDYDFVKNGSHKVHARPQAVKQGLADYSLKAGIELLKIIEDFVQVEYSLQKMDQISFPDDYFAAGAMENWGLVTYR